MFRFGMDAKSIIRQPSYPMKLSEPGFWEIKGIFPFGETPGLTKTIGNYWPYAARLYEPSRAV